MPFVVGESIGPYRIIEQLGQGGMATVFKAYHAALDRYVAIKALHPAFMEDTTFLVRFQREARVVARLEHPNIVPIYDFSEYEGRPYLVMKFIEGETLKARLMRGPLPPELIQQVAQVMGLALAYAHKQGILHRDVKPSNVLLARDGQIYLADFGLARIAAAGESTLSSDMVLGTPQYISPEQALGKRDLDAGTDIYSFGVLLYELVVGKVPFSGDTPYAVIHDHIYTPLPLPRQYNPAISESVERVLLKALAKERADRYTDVPALVSAFCRALEACEQPVWPAEAKETISESPLPAADLASQPALSEPVTAMEPPERATQASQSVIAAAPHPTEPAVGAGAPVRPTQAVTAAATAVRGVGKKPPKKNTGVKSTAGLAQGATRPPKRWLRWLIPVGLVIVSCVVLIALFQPGEQRVALRLRELIARFGSSPTTVVAAPTLPKAQQAEESTPVQPEALPPDQLYRVNFDDGLFPVNWITDRGWRVQNGQFCGQGQALAAYQPGGEWQDYAIHFRLKIDAGVLRLNIRQVDKNRYFIVLTPDGVMLNKQREFAANSRDRIQENIQISPFRFAPGQWHAVTLASQGPWITLMVDGVVVLNYEDKFERILMGSFSFETMTDASVCFDDLVVEDRGGKPLVNVLYENRFDQPVGEAWRLGPSWGVLDGALCGKGNEFAALQAVNLVDFDATFRLLLTGQVHLSFQSGDQTARRYLVRLSSADGQVTLRQQLSGSSQRTEQTFTDALAVGRANIPTGIWHEMLWKIQQGSFTLFVDGNLAINYQSPEAFGEGLITFETLDSIVCVDNLTITLPTYVLNP